MLPNSTKRQKGLQKSHPHLQRKRQQDKHPMPFCHQYHEVTHLIVMRRQLVQKLLDARLFPRAVDVGHLVFWKATVVLVHLGSKNRHQLFLTEQSNTATCCLSFAAFFSQEGSRRAAAPAGLLPFALSASIALACLASCGDVSAPASAGQVTKPVPRQPPCCWLYLSLHLHQNPPGLFCSNL